MGSEDAKQGGNLGCVVGAFCSQLLFTVGQYTLGVYHVDKAD